jgi:hypothetical protein
VTVSASIYKYPWTRNNLLPERWGGTSSALKLFGVDVILNFAGPSSQGSEDEETDRPGVTIRDKSSGIEAMERWILGDSMIKHVRSIFGSHNACLRGKGIYDILSYVSDNGHRLNHTAAVVLLIGTNDVANNMELSVFERGYADLINRIKRVASWSVVFLCTILPRPVDARSKNRGVGPYNNIISRLADQPRCAFIPTWRAFCVQSERADLQYFAQDGLHLNHQGVCRLEDILRSKINDKMLLMYRQRFFRVFPSSGKFVC